MTRIQMRLWSILSSIFMLILTACSSTAVQSPSDASQNMQAASEMASADLAQPAASRASLSSGNSRILTEQRLGTKWGDDINSPITQVNLKRLSAAPIAETQIRYADKPFSGRGINGISLASGKISFSVVDDRGRTLPLYRDGQQYFLSAREG